MPIDLFKYLTTNSLHSIIISCLEKGYYQWTFSFAEGGLPGNRFQLEGHSVDTKTRLHLIRHILMQSFDLGRKLKLKLRLIHYYLLIIIEFLFKDDKRDYIICSLRFDGRRVMDVFCTKFVIPKILMIMISYSRNSNSRSLFHSSPKCKILAFCL